MRMMTPQAIEGVRRAAELFGRPKVDRIEHVGSLLPRTAPPIAICRVWQGGYVTDYLVNRMDTYDHRD